jgi:tetratricopeptide (TPR) repeat protein
VFSSQKRSLQLRGIQVMAVTAMLFIASGSGWAQDSASEVDDDPARSQAKILSDAGAAANDRGDHAFALEQFRRAYALYPSPNLRFNLGVTLHRLHRWDEAVDAFEDFLEAAPNAPSDARELARQRVAELASKLARVDIVVSAADAVVTIDGVEVKLPRTRALPLLPSTRTIAAHDQHGASASERVVLVAGEERRVELVLRAPVVIPAPLVPAQATASNPHAQRRALRLRRAAYGIGAVGVASLIVGATFASLTASLDYDLNHPLPGARYQSKQLRTAERFQVLEATFFSIGGAAATAGVILYVVGARESRRARRTVTSLAARPSRGALELAY